VSNKYDVAVVGAGPSGSTAAYHLAKSGARVLLLDKAKYPRVKPCGGGVTARCFEQAPVDLTPVVERVIDRVRFSFRLGNFMDYEYPKTLVYMTQRDRLDAFLAENAAAAGATFMDATPLRELTLSKDGARIATARDVFEVDVVVGADGANGIVARAAGLHSVPHAGETTGPETVWDALRILGAERIGHGTSAAEDEKLLEHLAQHKIPLEVCPSSNVATRAVASLDEHPITVFRDAGVTLTVNSDDPSMFGTSLNGENEIAARLLDLDTGGVADLARTAVRTSFAPEDLKISLLAEIDEYARA